MFDFVSHLVQRRHILRSAVVSSVYPAIGLLAAACGGNSKNGSETETDAAVDAKDSAEFRLPQQIVVAIDPYLSIQAALNDEKLINWRDEPKRAQAITLAYAARELQNHLELIGVNIPFSIGLAEPLQSSFVLAVADVASVHAPSSLGVDHKSLGLEGFAITPMDSHVYISSGSRVGVLHGVYRLLDHLGFNWFDPYGTQTPKASVLDEPIVWPKLREVPRVRLRGFWIYGDQPIPDEFAVWLARNRFNIGGRASDYLRNKLGLKNWGGTHDLLQKEFSLPGLFGLHPDWYALIAGQRRAVAASGDYFNPSFANVKAVEYFAERMIDRLENGDLSEIDILNIWPSDNRFNNFDQSPLAKALGNETDNLLHLYTIVCDRIEQAHLEGRLSRPVRVAGISYFLTMRPPTNEAVIRRLEKSDYLHLFYPIERSWAGDIDANLANRDTNRQFIADLAAWKLIAKFDYGVVEYHNFSAFAAVGLTDFQHLAHNFETLVAGREGLYAYMHPLLKNPGPRRLTNYLLSGLGWHASNVKDREPTRALTQRLNSQYFVRRYQQIAVSWREVHELMAQSVENAKELFGTNSLYWVMFQKLIWTDPFYSTSDAIGLIGKYRVGGTQDLPAKFSGLNTVRESFVGLDESIRLQEQARIKWQAAIIGTIDREVLTHMESDIAWFLLTTSRYRLMAATCDYLVAKQDGLDLVPLRARMQVEIDFLQSSAVVQDTISPVNQRGFLNYHRQI
jgi:Domain of unknown function (DUF4838)